MSWVEGIMFVWAASMWILLVLAIDADMQRRKGGK